MRARCLVTGMALLLGVSAAGGVPAAAQEPAGAQVPAASTAVIKDVAYGPHPRHVLDVYPVAARKAGTPIVVTVQGSGWTKGDKSGSGIVRLNRSLQDSGFVVVSIDYRLATPQQDGVPMQTDDIERAVQWVARNGGKYGGDTDTISLLGGSSSAQLVALAGQLINARHPGLVSGVIEMSGIMDFVSFFNRKPAPRPDDHPGASTYLGCRPGECTVRELKEASPAWRITPACPDYLLINGTNELTPVSQPQFMHEQLEDARCSSTLRLVPGTQHGLVLYGKTQRDIIFFLNNL